MSMYLFPRPHSSVTEDMLRLAVEDFNTCQSMYQNELAVVERYLFKHDFNYSHLLYK